MSLRLRLTILYASLMGGVLLLFGVLVYFMVTTMLVSEVDKEESRALSGLPGLTEIPGLSSITSIEAQKNYATLLIIVTPHVVRETQSAGHTPMIRIARGQTQTQ